ncbi:MAG TPA: hypothetical protein VEI03_12230 [Stellaceae bacterium]|nr:hypothetical protein [Stellaceae bacterium]
MDMLDGLLFTLSIFQHAHPIGKSLKLAGDARSHCQRNSRSLIDANEVVVHEMDGDGMRVVLESL